MFDATAVRKNVVVIGGGLSGLVAAHRLIADGGLRPGVDVQLFESKNRLGGAIWTDRGDGFILEGGADSFITNKPWGVELCRALGLSDHLIETDAKHRRSFVVFNKRLVPVPEGFVMLAPTRLLPVLTTPLLTLRGKLRLLMDLFLPRQAPPEESLAAFVRRRLGRQALDRLVQPLIGGIYTADPNELSLQATMPQFADMERQFGSILRGAARMGRDTRKARQASGARYGLFVTLDQGMDGLINELAASIGPGAIETGTAARRIVRDEASGRWRVELLDGTSVDAGAVVLATEAHAAARLLDSHNADLAQHLRSIPYASSVVVNVAYRRDSIAHPLDGFGVVVPAVERRRILAISFTSIKFPGRAPQGSVLMRVFLGGALQPEIFELDDLAIEEIVASELRELLGVHGPPSLFQINRHARAMPQYTLGHLERVAEIRRLASQHAGLFLTGNAYDGVGIPDCVRGAQQVADAVLSYLLALSKVAA